MIPSTLDRVDLENIFLNMKKDPIPYITTNHSIDNLFIIQTRPSMVQELHSMCMKTHYKEKHCLFYKSLLYLDIIMFEAQVSSNVVINYNLICLNSLSLGIKFTQNQINIPRISQLQHLSRKSYEFTLEECLINETLCVELLHFRLTYSSCYDYLEMFLVNKTLLFEKARDLLDRICSQRLFVQKHPYAIACIIVSYCLELLSIRDLRIQRRFIYDKNHQFYQKFVNIIINTPNYNGNGCLRSSSSSLSTSTTFESQGSQKDIMMEKYIKIRQSSKNIEMMKTLELKKLMDVTQGNKQCDDQKNDDDNEDELKVRKIQGKRDLKQLKEHTRRSCINVFVSSNSSIKMSDKIMPFLSTKAINKDTNTNNINSNNYNSVSNSKYNPETKVFNCLSDKKLRHNVNIDLSAVTKFNIRQVATFNNRRGSEIK